MKRFVLTAVLVAGLVFPAAAKELSLEGLATTDIKATTLGGKFSRWLPWSKAGAACLIKEGSTWRYVKLRRALWAEVVVQYVPYGAVDACRTGQHVSILAIQNKAGIAAQAAKKN